MPQSGSSKPAFLITIDTEGDNLWSRPRTVATRNAEFLPRFQGLCERYGLSPTYLTNWEMAASSFFQEFGRDVLARSAGEIGMHLHAWNSPPAFALTPDDMWNQPYLTECPPDVLRAKVEAMTTRLRDIFDTPIVSHRGGRWAFDSVYAKALADAGYLVDCSVTPHYSWRTCIGAPDGAGGPDYRSFPDRPYLLDLDDPSRPGRSALLEIPVSIVPQGDAGLWSVARALGRKWSIARRVVHRLRPEFLWPYPGAQGRSGILKLLRLVVGRRLPYFMLVLHSSELMPGGSPRFATSRAIEKLYELLEELFESARGRLVGLTLRAFHDQWHREQAGVGSVRRETVPLHEHERSVVDSSV